MKAKPIQFEGFTPYQTPTDATGLKWLYAHYTADGTPPWQWPKYVEYDGNLYRFSCFNSDDLYVCYKQANAPKQAKPIYGPIADPYR